MIRGPGVLVVLDNGVHVAERWPATWASFRVPRRSATTPTAAARHLFSILRMRRRAPTAALAFRPFLLVYLSPGERQRVDLGRRSITHLHALEAVGGEGDLHGCT